MLFFKVQFFFTLFRIFSFTYNMNILTELSFFMVLYCKKTILSVGALIRRLGWIRYEIWAKYTFEITNILHFVVDALRHSTNILKYREVIVIFVSKVPHRMLKWVPMKVVAMSRMINLYGQINKAHGNVASMYHQNILGYVRN